MNREQARGALFETLLSWSVDAASSSEVVQDASVAVAEGADASWVVALACLSPDASANDVEGVLNAMPPDLDVRLLPRGNPDAIVAAGMVVVRRCAAGHLTERDLARWAHAVIGHGRSAELEPLVSLDDSYDDAEYFGDSIEAVHKLPIRPLGRVHDGPSAAGWPGSENAPPPVVVEVHADENLVKDSSEVQLSWPARAVFVATFLPVALLAVAAAPISVGFSLPFAAAFFWICWWCSSQGANPPTRPWLFVMVSGLTIPFVVWATVLLEGALHR